MKKIVLEEQAIRLIQQLSERKLQEAVDFLITLGKAGNSDRPTKGSKPLTGLGTAIHNTFAPIGGVELEIPKRGPGTMKDAVIGAVSREGHVTAQLIPDISGDTITNFIRENVDTENSTLYTDQFKGYNTIGNEMDHETLNRSEKWEKGEMHANTIEGFWTFIKRQWYGSHHHYSTGYPPLYLTEGAISITTEKLICLRSFSGRVWKYERRFFG